MTNGTTALTALLQRASIDDPEDILKACNASLKQSKRDPGILHAKAVALIKLDRYEDALCVFEDGGDTLRNKAPLEYSYALYKAGQLSDARQIAKGIVDERGARHVEAQALYRLESFDDAARVYQDLARTHKSLDSEENDIRINTTAIDAQLEWNGSGEHAQKKKPRREDLEAFETAYNAGCVSVAREDFSQALVLLKRSEDLCNAAGDLSDEEKSIEILPIQVQQIYVLSKLGKIQEADHLASQLSTTSILDASTQYIARNNVISASKDISNLYLAHRLLHTKTSISKTDKLFTNQSNLLQENRIIMDLLISKHSGMFQSTSNIITQSPEPTTSEHLNKISVLNAAALAQSRLGNFGIKHMLPLLEKRPLDVGLTMVILQLYTLSNNHGAAVTVLESLLKNLEASSSNHQDVRFSPGLVATAVSLYSLQERRAQVKTELAKAASYWRHKSKPPKSLLQAAGLGLLESDDPDDQASSREIFTQLHEQDPTSKIATAAFVAAHALSSKSTMEEAKSLTPIPRLIADVDVSALEDAGVVQPKLGADAAQAASRKRALDEKPKPAKKRLRKSRLPKEYDPNRAPDPERWLPLKERSSYRPKGKKGRQKAAVLTQGGVEKAGDAVGTSGKSSEGVVKAASNAAGGKAKNKKKSKR
ncbi:MAG: hypothetical protein Q9222_005494 [Ikaeria aurantiellina]